MTTYKQISNKTRKLIIQARENMKIKQIASTFEVPIGTVKSILKTFKSENRIDKKVRGGKKNIKVTEEIKDFLCQKVDEKCDITLDKLSDEVFNFFSVRISASCVYRSLKNLHFTFKKIKLIANAADTEQNRLRRIEYSHYFQNMLVEVSAENVFFIDEAGFNVSMRSKFGRSLRGTSPILTVPSIRSRNYSVCCAMNKNGNIYYKLQNTAYNTISYADFISDFILWLYDNNKKNVIMVMDNVAFHKNTDVVDIIVNSGHEIVFIPPYTPQFNPIENLFSKWKQYVRYNSPNTAEELLNMIEDGLGFITPDDCSGFFRNMMRELRKYSN